MEANLYLFDMTETNEVLRIELGELRIDHQATRYAVYRAMNVFFEKKLKDLFTDENFIENVCLSYRHDFGLMTDLQREQLIFECKEWMRAIENNYQYAKAKNPDNNYEYEMFFDDDGPISIHGWYPISTDRIKHPEKIEEYIAKGLLRRIEKPNK